MENVEVKQIRLEEGLKRIESILTVVVTKIEKIEVAGEKSRITALKDRLGMTAFNNVNSKEHKTLLTTIRLQGEEILLNTKFRERLLAQWAVMFIVINTAFFLLVDWVKINVLKI